jgi:signal transduction histidine kinase
MKYNLLMPSPAVLSRFAERLLNLTGWFTIGVVAIISFVSIDDPAARWVAVGLCLAFVMMDCFFPRRLRPGFEHVFFAVGTLLTVGLMALKTNSFVAPILFFILSAEVMVNLPLRQAWLWIVVFVVITAIFTVISFGLFSGLLSVLPYVGGYSFFGAFGKAMRDANDARQESQRLLEELRTAHQQLQEYAAQAQQLAVSEERNRLSRELHDSLGHRLTVAVVQLEGAQRLIPTDPERAARMIGTMREQMKEALGDLRRTLAALRAPIEDNLPLEQSLTRLAQTFQEGTGLAVQLTLSPELPSLPPAHRLALYRAAQESLTNAQRHAHARQVWLRLSADNGRVMLTADDDGQGLPADLNGGFGLKGLQERAAQLGGELQLGSGPHGGAQVQFSLPIDKPPS